MKKLVYILSIAIGLFMTGCAQWEDFESLSPSELGTAPVLTVDVDPTCVDEAGNIIKDALNFTIATEHATHVAYALSTSPADVDFTYLLQGMYGNFTTEIEGETYEQNISIPVEAGLTYYIYAVAANANGVQATVTKAIGAIDVTAPVIVSAPQLTAVAGGTRATLAFNEPILRDETMGEISFVAYDLNTNEQFTTGVITDAVSQGSNLVVTLPATVEFAAEGTYLVVLSFAEGAVTDLFGNKMAAVAGVYDADNMDVTTGYWWAVMPQTPGDDSGEFFTNGAFAFGIVFTEQGEQYGGSVPVTLSLVSESFDLSQIFNSITGTGKQWDIEGLLTGIYGTDGVKDMPFTGVSYTYEAQGMTVQDITMVDPVTFKTQIGEIDAMGDGTYYPAYIGAYEGNSISLYWDFILLDATGNPDAPVEDLVGYFAMDMTPVLAVYGDLGKGESYYILMEFDDLTFNKGGDVKAGSYVKFDQPVKVENAVVKTPSKSFHSIQVR